MCLRRGRRATRGRRCIGAAVAIALETLLPGRAGLAAQAPGPRYHPALLDCAVYRQRIASDIELESGANRSRERAGREGILVLRAAAEDSLILLEAWFDSLSLWREGNGGRTAPEADGVIGGRFRGTLTALGAYRPEESPFVPDEVAAVSDVASALLDFFPPLPAEPLDVGGTLQVEPGWRLTRLGDGFLEGRRTQRYRLERRLESVTAGVLPDSVPVAARRTEEEEGVVHWDPERGLVRWERAIRAEASVPSGPGVPRAFRTAIRQQVVVARLPGPARECDSGQDVR